MAKWREQDLSKSVTDNSLFWNSPTKKTVWKNFDPLSGSLRDFPWLPSFWMFANDLVTSNILFPPNKSLFPLNMVNILFFWSLEPLSVQLTKWTKKTLGLNIISNSLAEQLHLKNRSGASASNSTIRETFCSFLKKVFCTSKEKSFDSQTLALTKTLSVWTVGYLRPKIPQLCFISRFNMSWLPWWDGLAWNMAWMEMHDSLMNLDYDTPLPLSIRLEAKTETFWDIV